MSSNHAKPPAANQEEKPPKRPDLPTNLSEEDQLKEMQWKSTNITKQLERMRETANTQGIVLSLLLTLTFTSSLQPPGGWDSRNTGWFSLSPSPSIKLFAFFNSVSFCIAISGLSLYSYAGMLFVKPKDVVFEMDINDKKNNKELNEYLLNATRWNLHVLKDLLGFASDLSNLIRLCVYFSLLTAFGAFVCVGVAGVANVNIATKMVVYVPMVFLTPLVLFCIWSLNPTFQPTKALRNFARLLDFLSKFNPVLLLKHLRDTQHSSLP